MKLQFIVFVLFFSVAFSVSAQLSKSQQEKLAILLTQKVNKLRTAKGKQPLERHLDLAKAAKLHSDYMVKWDKLTHNEVGTKFPTPADRVHHFNKAFTAIGENVLFTKRVTSPIPNTELKQLASSMYKSWRNSPGHYANMISDTFTFGDFGFTYSKKTKRIYATQVFAKKGYIVEGQLSDNAFGILPQNNSCDAIEDFHDNVVVNIGNAIDIENGEVFLAHHNIETIKEVFVDKNDGIAVDLVERDQLRCNEDNRLDASTIYDGVMLRPIYKDALFANNSAQNPRRFIVSLGKIPKALLGKKLSPNIIIIKNGRKCGYAVTTTIPRRKYDLRPIEAEILQPNLKLKTENLNGIYEINLDFESNKTTPINVPDILIPKGEITAIEIKSYASVDGNAKANEKLHKARADFIEEYLNKRLKTGETPITRSTKENWELCFYQLELLGLDAQLGRDKERIKTYLRNETNALLKSALSKQRQSKAIIYTTASLDANNPYFLNYNLTDALLGEDYALANKVLAEMYVKDDNSLFLNESFITENLFDKEELVQNVAAVLLKNITFYDLDNIVYFIRNWLSKPEMLSKDAQKNLLNLYTITARRILSNWDTSTEDFSKVMHPEKVEPLFESYKNQAKVNPLFLNFHMARIQYFGQTNEGSKISESFRFITNYFENQSSTIKDDIDLGLFFNRWSMYQMTIDKLYSYYEYDELDETAAFLLVKTYVAYHKEGDLKTLLDIHKKTIQLNKDKWCIWMTKYFQNLRNEGIKKLYCKTCNGR